MDYASQLSEAKKVLQSAQNILVAVPAEADLDQLAAGLALFLSLQQVDKNADMVSAGTIKVGHTILFGVGQMQNQLPPSSSGDLIITLAGVVSADAEGKPTVPALEKLDYYPEGADLNLVFKVLPGQKFEPSAITPHYKSSGYDLIFVVGAPALTALGSIYNTRTESFSGAHIVNIDNKQTNTQFGTSNVVDPTSTTVSETMTAVLPALDLPLEGDIATNILTGIFAATNNLSGNSSANTFEAVARALRAGGQKPGVSTASAGGTVASTPFQPSVPAPAPVAEEPEEEFEEPELAPTLGTNRDNFTVPPVVPEEQNQPVLAVRQEHVEEAPSPEEVPAGEEAITPELDWLIPKIYKGGSSKG